MTGDRRSGPATPPGRRTTDQGHTQAADTPPPPDAPADIPADIDAEAPVVAADLMARPSRLMEQAFATFAIAVGLAVLLGARNIEVRNETGGIDPRWWPSVIGVAIIVTAVWTTFNAFTGRRAEREVEAATSSGRRHVLVVIVLTAIALGVWYAGLSFLVIAPVYLIALNWVLGVRDLKSVIAFPAFITAFLYLVFHLLLKVPL